MNDPVGKSINRLDAWGKVTGQTLYPGDRDHPNQLWLKILFAEHPHARVKAIDASAALALPGVITVLTAADVPVNEYGLQTPDQPVLCGPGSTQPGFLLPRREFDVLLGRCCAAPVPPNPARTLCALWAIRLPWSLRRRKKLPRKPAN